MAKGDENKGFFRSLLLNTSETTLICMVLGANIIEKCFYSLVWFTPKVAYQINPTDPVTAVENLFMYGKVGAFSGVIGLALKQFQFGRNTSKTSIGPFVLGLAFLVFGQALNFAVYDKIGRTGVYYGVRFGKEIEWVSGFPFNLGFRDPQYVGSVLSYTGLYLMFFPKLDTGKAVLYNVGILAIYIAIAIVESTPAGEPALSG